jgi:hypothetical protein
VHPRIRRKRETVEFGSQEIRHVTNRVCGAQRADNRASEGTRAAGYDNMAVCEINHGDFLGFKSSG